MYQATNRSVAVAVLLAVFAGCAEKPPPPTTETTPGTTPAKLAARVAGVNIFDDRKKVDEPGRLLHMPENTIVGEHDEVNPTLSRGERQLIENQARSYFTGKGRAVDVDIYVTNGRQFFQVSEMQETVRVDFAVRVEIGDKKNVIDVVTALGEATFSEQAVDVPPLTVAELYGQAIRESVRDAFDKLAAGP